MVDITHKSPTLRKAIAQAIVCVSSQATIDAIINKKVPKGDVFEMAKVAGLFAAKRTSDMIPDCHPLPIEYTSISYRIEGLEIYVHAEIHTIYKTGVEVEAMHAASVVALTMYDMLKPIDKAISINQIKLLEKKGGKSDFLKTDGMAINAAVIVCSDTISKGEKEDRAGKIIIEKLEKFGVKIKDYRIIPDEFKQIQDLAQKFVKENVKLIVFTGGTGLSPRDVTPDALRPIIEREIPGIEEAIRSYGQQRMPMAMLSRSVAGQIGKSLVLALPGSTKGAAESMDAIFPAILHVFKVLEGKRHD
ncbi:bifunctional molybdenum cofactor biosynthesis protein MoaC/MoaB [Shivajiella indica]|uniref:Molybdopterin adenylyltransferase n=1 Tax=Shivajiella indica TaxID=872115 RepID=A0ABW5B820_9BACT